MIYIICKHDVTKCSLVSFFFFVKKFQFCRLLILAEVFQLSLPSVELYGV
jgi:hypothetical protein